MQLKYKSFREGDIVIKYSERPNDEKYMQVAYTFLQKLMKEFARLSIKSHRPDLDSFMYPFLFSERRFDSVILPALFKICDGVVLNEVPVQRVDKEKSEVVGSGHGRNDFWCIFKGYTFIIEMKRSWDKVDGIVTKKTKDRWKGMVEQLENSADECRSRTEITEGVIRLGLHFMTSYISKTPTEELVKEYRGSIKNSMDVFVDELCDGNISKVYTPSFAATWLLPDYMIFSDPDSEELDETEPGVMLFATIFKPIKHK